VRAAAPGNDAARDEPIKQKKRISMNSDPIRCVQEHRFACVPYVDALAKPVGGRAGQFVTRKSKRQA
jgi:hypothetical protein